MFIIPMCGLSSRFFKAGYDKPKYMLELNNRSVFNWSITSFERYFFTDKFIIIYRNVYNTKEFLLNELSKLNIRNCDLIELNEETEGQAHTVYLGLKKIKDDYPIYIFNIDSRLNNFIKLKERCDGYLEVFEGDGNNWSFVLPDENNNVIKTTEKERISNLCSNGLYYFSSKELFNKTFEEAYKNNQKIKNEFFIAPLYNNLIAKKFIIKYKLVNKEVIQFCGIPEEYENLKKLYKAC